MKMLSETVFYHRDDIHEDWVKVPISVVKYKYVEKARYEAQLIYYSTILRNKYKYVKAEVFVNGELKTTKYL